MALEEMNEKYVRDRVRDMLKSYDYVVDVQTDAITCSKCHTQIVPPRGRPDLTAIHRERGYGIYVEVKTVRRNDTSFPFSRIEEQQRDRLSSHPIVSHIAIGDITRSENSSVDRLSHLWLVPWAEWLKIEDHYVEVRKSMPRGDMTMILARFALTKESNEPWRIPWVEKHLERTS